MLVVRVPPLAISLIADTQASWRWVEGQTPVDFTQTVDGEGWSAEIIVYRCRDEVLRAPVALDAGGYLSVTIPVAVAEKLRSCRRIDATYQINITAPLPDLSEVWAGPVVVQEERA